MQMLKCNGENFCVQRSDFRTLGIMGGSPGDVSEEPVTQEMRKKGWRMSCDVGEETEGLENEL